MARRTRDFSDISYTVKEDAYRELSREAVRNGRNVMLNNDWDLVLDLHDHAFLAELDNMQNLTNLIWESFDDGHRYFLCTTSYMSRAVLRWSAQSQKARWKSLREKGYVHIRHCEYTSSRYVRVDYKKLLEDIAAAKLKEAEAAVKRGHSGSPVGVAQNSSTAKSDSTDAYQGGCMDPYQGGCMESYQGGIRIPTSKTHDKTHQGRHIKEDTMSRTAPAASPPPGDGTVCISDPQPKQPTATPTIEADTDDNHDTSPPPSSASPPPSRGAESTPHRDKSWRSNLELEEDAIFAADMKERDEHGRKKRKYLRRRNSS